MKKPDKEELLDMWLTKYHNTNVQELIAKHPKEVLESPEWFKLYPVIEQQHDEWVKECKQLLRSKYKMPKWMIEKGWWSIYLDCSPSISNK